MYSMTMNDLVGIGACNYLIMFSTKSFFENHDEIDKGIDMRK